MHAQSALPESTTAEIAYTVDTGEKLVNGSPAPGVRLNTGTYDHRTVRIRNGRGAGYTLEKDGFELVEHHTRATDLFDARQLQEVYYPEMVELVRRRTGAARVVVFDHTLRSGDEEERNANKLRELVHNAHNDYTEWSGPERVRILLPDEAEELLKRRFAIIQFWRPTHHTLESTPLALARAASVAPEDLLVAERHHPGRIGQIYRLRYNPAHEWVYFPRMRREEGILFTVYDSARDGRPRFTPHTAFSDPHTPPGALPRKSMEIRTIAFF
ncbi:MAG: methyltransferase [Betaproteobacteria bacterium]|nr:methyltransferase [Betaproteobacteria bacterium]